jgi:hypothetical protein
LGQLGGTYGEEVFYLGLALDPRYVNGALEFIGEDDGEDVLQGVWEDGEGGGLGLRPGGPRAGRIAPLTGKS